MWLTNAASATWQTVQGTFKASIILYPGNAYTLTLKPTDVHTNWSSRTHFASSCKKQAELKVSAGADNLTKTAVTGDDNVVCVFAHGFPQLHSIHEGPTAEVCSSRCGCSSQPCMVSHTWFISCSYSARTFEHTPVQCILHRHVHEYMEADNAHSYTHSPTLAHEHSHKHSQIKTRNQCNL